MENEAKIARLETSMDYLSTYIEKADATLDKLADLSQSIEKILVVHEKRLNDHDGDFTAIMKRFDSVDELIKIQNKRIAALEKARWIQLGIVAAFMFLVVNFGRLGALLAGIMPS